MMVSMPAIPFTRPTSDHTRGNKKMGDSGTGTICQSRWQKRYTAAKATMRATPGSQGRLSLRGGAA
jgi:hypothetical protein